MPVNIHEAPRVMHVLPSLENGGLQRAILDLMDNVPESEMSVAAVNFGGHHLEDFRHRGPVTLLNDVEGSDPHHTYGWFSPGPILRLASAMREQRPDIVQTHTFAAATIGRSAAKLAGVPTIIDTLHNTYTWKDDQTLRIDRWLGKITDKIVCVSQAVRDYAIEQNPGIPADKYEVLYNGVDTDRFHPRDNGAETRQRLGIDQNALVVGSVSRLAGQKRVSDLIAAAPDVLANFPEAHFLIVGDGPKRGALTMQVKELGLEKSFTFTGTRSDSELIYPACDVFAQTAEREGFGLSLAEAMASGTASIAAETGAIPELMQHDHNGLHYDPGDVAGLADGIKQLLGDPTQRQRLGQQAAADIPAKFDIKAVPDKYRELWTRVMASKAA